jgi:hypothetical protein
MKNTNSKAETFEASSVSLNGMTETMSGLVERDVLEIRKKFNSLAGHVGPTSVACFASKVFGKNLVEGQLLAAQF